MTEQDKVTVDDIIGIVKTEEQTNSVEEVRKLRGRGNETAKRFYLNEGDVGILKIFDIKEDNERIYLTASKSDMKMVVELLNELHEENQHKQKLLHLAANKIDRLLEENEQLKSELKYYKAMVHTDTSR